MNTTAKAVNQSTASTTKQQKQTAKEIIAANVQALIEQLEQGHSEALTAYLIAMGRFHNYSFGNILEIARQSRTQPAWPASMRGTGLAARSRKGNAAFAFSHRLLEYAGRRMRKPKRTSALRTKRFWLDSAPPMCSM